MSTTVSAPELRQCQRRILRTTAHIVVSEHQTIEVRTVDISSGGMAIVAGANPRPGTTFVIRLALPDGSKTGASIEAQVQVTHSVLAGSQDGFKIGVRFLDLPATAAKAIAHFLK